MASNIEGIQAIVVLYRKHGWELRRVFLTSGTLSELGSAGKHVFGSVSPFIGEIDAAWFTRCSQPGTETWELRRLSDPPFALVEVFDDETPDSEREIKLTEIFETMTSSSRMAR